MGFTRLAKTSLIVVTAVLVLGFSMTMMVPTVQAASAPFTVSCVTYTQNGQHVGVKHCSPLQANDVHLQFSGHCSIQFSKDGTLIGSRVLCPQGVNDFTLKWDIPTATVTHFTWSTDGQSTGTVTVPTGANGFHFIAQSVGAFQWSLNGGLLGHAIAAPEGANDFEGGIKIVNPNPNVPEFPFAYSAIIMFVLVAAVYMGIRHKMSLGFKPF